MQSQIQLSLLFISDIFHDTHHGLNITVHIKNELPAFFNQTLIPIRSDQTVLGLPGSFLSQ